MMNAAGQVIYVGKAIDLRKRVSSYFQKSGLGPRMQLMVSQIAGIETTVTRSEAEALLLENNLIKTLTPRYNILFRDDKSYPYVILSGHRFPRLGFHRGALDKNHHYFGPFPNAGMVRESIQLLQKVFRMRTCEDSVFSNRTRPCLLYQIKRCSGPCVDLITSKPIRKMPETLNFSCRASRPRFWKALPEKCGKPRIPRSMSAPHCSATRSSHCEKSAKNSSWIAARRWMPMWSPVLPRLTLGEESASNLAMVRGGRHLGDKSFFPQNAEGYDPHRGGGGFFDPALFKSERAKSYHRRRENSAGHTSNCARRAIRP